METYRELFWYLYREWRMLPDLARTNRVWPSPHLRRAIFGAVICMTDEMAELLCLSPDFMARKVVTMEDENRSEHRHGWLAAMAMPFCDSEDLLTTGIAASTPASTRF